MKSIFRLYARTSKGNDAYLYQELKKFGLKPKHQELLHAFYFDATFRDIFNLSFHSFTIQNLYLQIGQPFYLPTQIHSVNHTPETQLGRYFRGLQFKNYLHVGRDLPSSIRLKVFVRESSKNIPSELAIGGILQQSLTKEIVIKEYKNMLTEDDRAKDLLNYYEMKEIVDRKWREEDLIDERIQLPRQESKYLEQQRNKQISQSLDSVNALMKEGENMEFKPHMILYIRRNHARLLLKMNKKELYKHGWKKNVGWGPIKQNLTASILYRSGLIEQAKKQSELRLWDPFCGSATIPLVACSMFSNTKIRQDVISNFIWPHWPVFKPKYLQQYQQEKKEKSTNYKILGSDINLNMVNHSISNMKEFLKSQTVNEENTQQFLKIKPTQHIYELVRNKLYVECGDFEQVCENNFSDNKSKPLSIVTNLPYLNKRSKQHHPVNQLRSIYKRFHAMLEKYKTKIENVFVVIAHDQTYHKEHFLKVGEGQWKLLSVFDNGGIEVGLYAWKNNKIQSKNDLQHFADTGSMMMKYEKDKNELLSEYRKQVKSIEDKQYELPKHMMKYRTMSGYKRVLEKRKARHLRAAYVLFSKRRDKIQAYNSYANKELALKLTRRGKSWRRRNMNIVKDDLLSKQSVIKKEFQSKIEEALKRSEQKKEKKEIKKKGSIKIKRKW